MYLSPQNNMQLNIAFSCSSGNLLPEKKVHFKDLLIYVKIAEDEPRPFLLFLFFSLQ